MGKTERANAFFFKAKGKDSSLLPFADQLLLRGEETPRKKSYTILLEHGSLARWEPEASRPS